MRPRRRPLEPLGPARLLVGAHAVKVRHREIGTGQVGSLQSCPGKSRIDELRVAQICTAQIGTLQRSMREVGSGEDDASQVGPDEDRVPQRPPDEHEAAEIAPRQRHAIKGRLKSDLHREAVAIGTLLLPGLDVQDRERDDGSAE